MVAHYGDTVCVAHMGTVEHAFGVAFNLGVNRIVARHKILARFEHIFAFVFGWLKSYTVGFTVYLYRFSSAAIRVVVDAFP
jgi:hypothetical protein